MESMMWFGIPAAGVIMALAEAIKRLGWVDSRYSVLVSIDIGVIGSVMVLQLADSDISQAVFFGIVTGLSVSGLYSTAKNVSGK